MNAPHNWRQLKRHALSEAFGDMEDVLFEAMTADMKQNGYDPKQHVLLYDGEVLDGWHRLRSAVMTDKVPTFDFYRGNDPVGEVIRLNFNRRHHTPSQRAMIAAKLVTITASGRPSGKTDIVPRGTISQSQAAEMVNVDRKRVNEAVKVNQQGTPELQKAVEKGTISVGDAARVATEPARVQRAAVKDVEMGKATTATGSVRNRAGGSTAQQTRDAAAKRIARQTGVAAPDTIECPQCHGKGRVPRPVQVPFPDGLDTKAFREAWDDWFAYRRESRFKPYTETGAKQQLKRLAEWGAKRAIAAIAFSIGQKYQGIFEPNGHGNGKPEPFAGIREFVARGEQNDED